MSRVDSFGRSGSNARPLRAPDPQQPDIGRPANHPQEKSAIEARRSCRIESPRSYGPPSGEIDRAKSSAVPVSAETSSPTLKSRSTPIVKRPRIDARAASANVPISRRTAPRRARAGPAVGEIKRKRAVAHRARDGHGSEHEAESKLSLAQRG